MSVVSELMSKKNVVSIYSNSEITAFDISKLMVKNKVGSVLVINHSNFPIGIVTERDIIKKVCVTNTLPNEMKEDQQIVSILSLSDITRHLSKILVDDYKRFRFLKSMFESE